MWTTTAKSDISSKDAGQWPESLLKYHSSTSLIKISLLHRHFSNIFGIANPLLGLMS